MTQKKWGNSEGVEGFHLSSSLLRSVDSLKNLLELLQ